MKSTEKQKFARQRFDWLKQGLQNNLVPAFMERGFEVASQPTTSDPVDREFVLSFPTWGRLRRFRESAVDLVEIQLAPHRRAAFRINAGVAPRAGNSAHGERQAGDQVPVHTLEERFETHARPWLRPLLRGLRLEPLCAWFSVGHHPFRPAVKDDFEGLALRAASVIPELELALREGKTGPHVRRVRIPWSRRPAVRGAETR